jgi:bifunctional ADP-heptose synthase (sugar kinase/adenylyltransferase)
VIGLAGGDQNEEQLTECMRSNSIASQLIVSASFPTIKKLRNIGGPQQMLRLTVNEPASDRPITSG